MIRPVMKTLAMVMAVSLGLAAPVLAQEPPRIVIGSAVIEPMPIAVPTFIDEGGAGHGRGECRGRPDHGEVPGL